MGLASKMAATSSGAGAPPAGAPSFPPQPQQSYGAPAPPHGAPPGYGAPPSAAPNSRPGSYQAPPPQQHQQGQYAPPSGPPPIRTGSINGPPAGSQYGQQPPQSPAYGQPPQSPYGQQPQQGQYGQQQQQYGAPPQQAYGAPPPQQHHGGAPLDPRQVESVLQQCVQDQGIHAFYPPGSLGPIAQRVAQSGALDAIATQWKLDKELAMDLIKLSLFDTVLLIDDSGSMAFEEGGERIDDLKLILGRCAYAASLFDLDGIQVRFLNSNVEGNGIRDEAGAMNLLSQIRYSGLTPLGTSLDKKILQPLVLGPARAGRLEKPVLIIAITDGTPAGEPKDHIIRVISQADSELKRSRYGPDAVSYQFAQVGTDLRAQAFLSELDTDPIVGGLIDATSNYESEEAEMAAKSGMQLTPELWLLKLLMGGIDSSYDEQDESK